MSEDIKNKEFTSEEVDEFVQNMDYEDINDKLYLAYLMECGAYTPTGNLTIDQIFSMSSLETDMALDKLESLENWENAELEAFAKKQKETLTRHQAMEIYEVCTGVCVCMGMHNSEIDKIVSDEIGEVGNMNDLTNDFENSDLSTYFMGLRMERDAIKGLETADLEELKKIFGEEAVKNMEKESEVSRENLNEDKKENEQEKESSSTETDAIGLGPEF